jgi:hypothetical protein
MKRLIVLAILSGIALPAVFGQGPIPPVKTVLISGTVFDDPFPMKRMSMPIQGASVKLWVPLAAILNGAGTDVLPQGYYGQLIDSAVTDTKGAFAFASHTPGSYQITMDQKSFNSRHLALNTVSDTTLNILMVAAGAEAKISGTIYAACTGILGMPCILQPVPNCTVTVYKQTDFPVIGVQMMPVSQLSAFQAVSNAQGQYAIDSVPVSFNGETVTVSSSAAGFVSQSVDTTIQNTMTTTVNLSLSKTAAAPKDTVYVTPPRPSAGDSLQFRLSNAGHCCATVYRNNTVSVSDTTIFLSCTYDDSLCSYVDCLVGGSQTSFSSKPIPAGRYAIYKVESMYCPPGRMCPMLVTAPVRVGSLTVTVASTARPTEGTIGAGRGTDLVVTGTSATVTIAQNARVRLRAYDVRGALISNIFEGLMSAGGHQFALRGISGKVSANGVVVLRLSIEGKSAVTRTLIIPR